MDYIKIGCLYSPHPTPQKEEKMRESKTCKDCGDCGDSKYCRDCGDCRDCRGYRGCSIPDNCHFFYTDAIFGAKILHPNARISGQIGFCDKIA